MRVVISDRRQEVASGLVERKTQDGACYRDVEAGLSDQCRAQAPLGEAGATGQYREPGSVDLHWTKIVGAVSVVRDAAEMPGFDPLDGGERLRRQVIEGCHRHHAGQQRRRHRQ